MRLVLASRADVLAASRLVRWLNRPAVEQVVVAIPALSERERQRIATKLQGLFNDCGCAWGAPAFLVTLGLLIVGSPWRHTSSGVAVAMTLAGAVAAAVLAKLTALAWSRWRMKALFSRLMGA